MIYRREMNSDNCYLHVAKIISFLVGFCGARTMTDKDCMQLKVHVRVYFSFMVLRCSANIYIKVQSQLL